ncbi:MAG: nitrophenyl compound nitroreductase subunit ArsF family protein [Verrucomicrobiota bacterium]
MSTPAETTQRWISRLLIGFVLVTVGFAAGRRTAPSLSESGSASGAENDARGATANQVVVYAAHMTFRCPECTQIEWLTRELVENEFEEELTEGRLDFRTVDYMKNTDFARKYDISSSTVVVVRKEGGEEQEYRRLDKVWSKIKDRNEFFDYVRSAIRDSLGGEEGET